MKPSRRHSLPLSVSSWTLYQEVFENECALTGVQEDALNGRECRREGFIKSVHAAVIECKGPPCIPKLQARVSMGAAGAFFYDRRVAIPANKRKPQRELFAGASQSRPVL